MVDRIQDKSRSSQESNITKILLGTEKKGFFRERDFTVEIPGQQSTKHRTIGDAALEVMDYLRERAKGLIEISQTPQLEEYCSRWGPHGGDITPEREVYRLLVNGVYFYNAMLIAENKSKEQK